MLRNSKPGKCLIEFLVHRQRQFGKHFGVVYNKNTSNVLREGKIISKLFGNRVAGTKKRWIPRTDAIGAAAFKDSQFGKKPNSGDGKNATRRMVVLNKLFMKHITDLMATGEISESMLGKGLQISKVKISQDFAYVNVFWLTTGEIHKDTQLEQELQRCSGLLRHELSQLGLMGVVPRIKFVKDKLYTNGAQVEALLKNMNFGKEENEENDLKENRNYASSDIIKQNFFYNQDTLPIAPSSDVTEIESKIETTNVSSLENFSLPEMRHDVFGLDHKGIMLKIQTKLKKSKQAWEQHQQKIIDGNSEAIEESIANIRIGHMKDKLPVTRTAEETAKFEAFIAKRKERKTTPERKKYRSQGHYADLNTTDGQEAEVVLSERQRQWYEAEDYLLEELEDKKR